MKYVVCINPNEMFFKGFHEIKGYSMWTCYIQNCMKFNNQEEALGIKNKILNSFIMEVEN